MSTLTVIASGGTIASVSTEGAAPRAALSGHDVVARLVDTGLVERADVVDVCCVNGWNIDLAHVRDMATAIERSAATGTTGVLITHGTDTIEDTAFLLDAVCGHLTTQMPIVITGAMESASAPEPDGPGNVRQAAVVATSSSARGRGVLVVMHNEVHRARDVRKVRTSGFCPFASDAGPVGRIVGTRLVWAVPPYRSISVRPRRVPTHIDVGIVAFAPGDDGRLVEWFADQDADGLVLVGFGAGNIPGGAVDAVSRFAQTGRPVVVTSRAHGQTAPLYSGPGSNGQLLELGVIDGRGLTPAKARTALMLAIDNAPDDVSRWFGRLIEGE